MSRHKDENEPKLLPVARLNGQEFLVDVVGYSRLIRPKC